MKLCILPEDERVREMYDSHTTFHEGDSGLDVYFTEDINMEGLSTKIVSLGISCEAFDNEGDKNVSYYLYPRSSISRTPLRMSNSVGIIDAGYRGTLKVAVDNTGAEPFTINRGDRLFQICSPDLSPIHMSVVTSLSETTRGTGGFGSTGQ